MLYLHSLLFPWLILLPLHAADIYLLTVSYALLLGIVAGTGKVQGDVLLIPGAPTEHKCGDSRDSCFGSFEERF